MGPKFVDLFVSHGPDVINARLEGFMRYETSLLEQVQDYMASTMPTGFVFVPDEESKPHPVKLDVRHYTGKEGANLALWIREVEWP